MQLNSIQISAFKIGLGNILTNLQSQVAASAYAENLPVVGGGLATGTGAGLTKITALKQALDTSLGSLAGTAAHEQVLAKVNEALGKAGFSKTAKLTGGGAFEVDFSDVTAAAGTEFSAPVAGDAGLAHLGLTLAGAAQTAGRMDYDFNFRAGLGGGGEAYVESTGTNLLELLLHLDAGKGFTVDGNLGGVPYDVKAAAGAALLDATLGFALTDGDGRLNASEAGGSFIEGSIITGGAKPVLSLAADLAGAAYLPKLVNTLVVDWNLAGAALNPADDNSAFGERPLVNFNNVGFDISAFISGLAADGGFVTTALDVAGPIIEICQKLSAPLPVVGEILQQFGLGGTLIDVFTGPGSAEALAVKGIAALGGFFNTLQNIKGSGKLDLGSFGFDNSVDIRSPIFSLAGVQPSVTDFGVGVLNSGPVKALADAVSLVPGLSFPILQTEGEIFKMVLGQAANIVTYDAAPITFGVSQDISFPLFLGINGRVGFAASGEIHLGLGYDTSGLSGFVSSGDAQDLLNGIFFTDYGSTGAEIPEALFTAEITAGVSAGIPGIFEVGVEGGIRGVVNYDFADAFTAADRKLSFDELASVNFNPFAVADISGRIDAFLAFFVESLFYSKSKDLGTITLFDFETQKAVANAASAVKLATKSGGELLINVGTRAGERTELTGDIVPDVGESIRIDESKAGVRVNSPKTKTLADTDLAPLGGQSVFTGITKITANGGEGDDVIVLQPGVKKPASLDGGNGGDILTGGSGADTILGGDGLDRIIGGAGNDKIYGDTLVPGFTGTTDILSGLDGNDTIHGGPGNDEIRGGAGNDTLYGYGTLFGVVLTNSDTGDDLFGGEGGDVLHGSNGSDTLDGGPGADVLFGYGGADTFRVDNTLDVVLSDFAFVAIIESTAPFYKMPAGFRTMILTTRFDDESGVTFTDSIGGDGNDSDNFLYGNNAANGLLGRGGSDFIFGLGGDDIIVGGDGDDTLEGEDGDDFLFAEGGSNTLRGGNGDDELHGGPLADVLEGGFGDDVYYTDNFAEISDTGGRDAIASPVSVDLADNPSIEGVQLTGGANADATGTDGDNFLGGNAGKNTLRGLGGNDRLVGGAGDTLEGGFGADVYVVDSEKAVVVEVSDTPSLLNSDVVLAKSSFTLPANVENLTLIGAGAKFGNGNNENNSINANGQAGVRAPLGQALTLDGRGGNDSVIGGDGGDTIFGGDGDDFVFGSAGNDTLRGGKKSGASTGNDELYGGAGDDTLVGGSGNDVLYGDKSVAGDDTGFPIGSGADVLDGGAGFNQLFGGAGNDRLITGGATGDTLDGGDGDDTYVFTGGAFNFSTILDSDGTDTVESFVDVDLEATFLGFPTISGAVEIITLTESIGANFQPVGAANAAGNSLANIIAGNSLNNSLDGRDGDDELRGGGGNDSLDGGPGRDRIFGGDGDDLLSGGNFSDEDAMHGGEGGDTYFAFAYDAVIEDPKHKGTDIVFYDGAANGYRLPRGVEDLFLHSSIVGANGNDLANKIIANANDNVIHAGRGNDSVFAGGGGDTISGESGNDTLDGEDGVDFLVGGAGDDVLIGGAGGDNLNGGDGRDTLHGHSQTGAGDDGAFDNLDGGEGNDTLFGGGGPDFMNGGSGDDTMTGGDGDDIYFVDSAKDKIIETLTGGFDSVLAGISMTIPENVERLALFGPGPLSATGRAGADILIGNDGANTLRGLDGNDKLVGWRGNDSLIGGDGFDTLYGDEGTQAIVDADVSGFRGSGNDVLDGGPGSDLMHGQRGDDLYLIESFGDYAFENPGEGVDTIRTTLTAFTLPPDVENLVYVAALNASPKPAPGKAAVDATFFGNGLPNIIIGGLGGEYLDGGFGNDTLIGGKGNDRYVVDSIADRVVERANEGVDIVLSQADDFVLPDHVENLDIVGTHALSFATGNALANVINGDANANGISGEGGHDRLSGGGGGDLILGGDGNDMLDGGADADDMAGGKGDDTFHVDDAGDTTQEVTGEGFDTVISRLANFIAQPGMEIEKIIVDELAGGAGATGNAIANIIIGNSQANGLIGGDGNDRLEGGGGDDFLYGVDLTTRGAGEIDTLGGGTSGDLFFLGDTSGAYYDDGNPDSAGKGDFALITDFKPADGDRVVFFGSSAGIIAKATGISANLGTGAKFYIGMGIYLDHDLDGVVDETGNPDELIGLIQNFLGGGLDFADYSVFLQV